jgi:hypothetical protein
MDSSIDYLVFSTDGSASVTAANSSAGPEAACATLERGGVIFFPTSPFHFAPDDRKFLLAQEQINSGYHKNISYRPLRDRVAGFKPRLPEDSDRLKSILSGFHNQATFFLRSFVAPYAAHWKPDTVSFRPIQEYGRKARLHARNDLVHVDSFPVRPTYGDRIFRVFVNINEREPRVWNTSDTFEKLAKQFAREVRAPGPLDKKPEHNELISVLKLFGLKTSFFSPYDLWMHRFHNFLKENYQFQSTCRKDRWEFPPNSAWLVFTDYVSHAVLSGQFALEQTTIVSKEDLVSPEDAPINVLARLYEQDEIKVSRTPITSARV